MRAQSGRKPTTQRTTPLSLDSELIRFRIDPQVRDKAAAVCADLGHELNDVLRTVVTRIAQEGTLPFSLGLVAREPAARPAPFSDYDDRLWAPVRPQIDAELALSLLAAFIADCSTVLDEQEHVDEPDLELVARLTREREQALRLRRELDVSDDGAVRRAIAYYGPRVRGRLG